MPILPKCDNIVFFPLWQVVNEYETRGFEFLLQAFNTPDYLEDITGLTELQRETENAEVRCIKLLLRHTYCSVFLHLNSRLFAKFFV